MVKPLDIRPAVSGIISHMSFSATLLELSSKRAIWVAKAEADGLGGTWEFAGRIVAALAESRMIPPARAAARPRRPAVPPRN